MAKTVVMCAYCGKPIDREKEESIKYKNLNFHDGCVQKQQERDDFFKYVCNLLGLRAPGAKIYSQLNSFFNAYPYYTYKGIKQALEYFYVIQNNPKTKSKGGIGIVPYVYDLAQEYYKEEANRKREIATAISEEIEATQTKVVSVKKEEQEKKDLYDLDSLL